MMNLCASSVAYADPHILCREAIAQLIESFGEYRVNTRVGNAEELLTAFDQELPDILLLEINLPGRSGIEVLHELKRRNQKIKTLLISIVDLEHVIKMGLSAGALGFFPKCASPVELEIALNSTRGGQRYIPDKLSHLLDMEKSEATSDNGHNSSNEFDPLDPLSAREREIFHLLANGMQNSTIAKQLFISPRTVETHRARVVRKLGLHSNSELIRYAIKHGVSVV